MNIECPIHTFAPEKDHPALPSSPLDSLKEQLLERYPGSVVLHRGFKTPYVSIVFHGMGQTPEDCSGIIDSLFERGFNVLCLTAPNRLSRASNRTRAPSAEILSDFCEDTVTFAASFGDSIAAYGFSMGAMLALDACVKAPSATHCLAVSPSYAVRHLSTPADSLDILRTVTDKRVEIHEGRFSPAVSITTIPTDLMTALFEYGERVERSLHVLDRKIKIVGIGNYKDQVINYRAFEGLLAGLNGRSVSTVSVRIPPSIGAVHHSDLSLCESEVGRFVVKICLIHSPAGKS